ncbi:MAG: type II toxin-antitoxin system VapB family antitoxin [Spirochaetales bacterium]|nr:type II toxin-antitoxin system VapB family antitoxin [Spirochaetales bacterium]
MRTTINLREDLYKKASELTTITSKTELIHTALKILIEKYSRERLAELGGTEEDVMNIPRRRDENTR